MQRGPRVHNSLPLPLQITQCSSTDILRLERDPLALPQPARRPPEPFGAREELLALLELVVCGWVVGVAGAEKSAAVAGEGL